jgi:argininosuccinate lyase
MSADEPSAANKLWQTADSAGLDPAVEAYTVGSDIEDDQLLLGYDIQASRAHATMLQSIGILTENELQQLLVVLKELLADWQQGAFTIKPGQEDGHTAIEQYLVGKLGDTGKKIHAGRSRNDQALVMMRLYLKDQLQAANELGGKVAKAFNEAAAKAGTTPMAGYTHMQKAMPTTIAMWLGSYADAFSDSRTVLAAALETIDQNPLGSAAGFGVSLPLDRELTTKELGFKKVQDNPMYCGLSRGLFELIAVQALNPLMVLAGKFAHDVLLFTTEEFNFMSLPDSFTTGSSIMPHKRNYDVFEVMRGRANTFNGYATQLQSVASGIGSGFQRDLQLTKHVTLIAFADAEATLGMLVQAVPQLKLNQANLEASITDDMHSVAEINRLVEQGMPFRDAYQQVKRKLSE